MSEADKKVVEKNAKNQAIKDSLWVASGSGQRSSRVEERQSRSGQSAAQEDEEEDEGIKFVFGFIGAKILSNFTSQSCWQSPCKAFEQQCTLKYSYHTNIRNIHVITNQFSGKDDYNHVCMSMK